MARRWRALVRMAAALGALASAALAQTPPAATYRAPAQRVSPAVTAAQAARVYVPPQWSMPDLVKTQDTDALLVQWRQRCRSIVTITPSEQSDARAAGTIIGQSPAAGAPLTCGTAVSVTKSSGPQPIRQWPIPDLSQPNGLALLNRGTTRYCDRAPKFDTIFAESRQGKRTIIGQRPDPGTMIDCDSAITVIRSSGPPATSEPPPPQWQIPDLRQPDGVARLQGQTQLYCRRSLAMGSTYGVSDAARDMIIGQSPDAGSTIDCTTAISVTRSPGPPSRPVVEPPVVEQPVVPPQPVAQTPVVPPPVVPPPVVPETVAPPPAEHKPVIVPNAAGPIVEPVVKPIIEPPPAPLPWWAIPLGIAVVAGLGYAGYRSWTSRREQEYLQRRRDEDAAAVRAPPPPIHAAIVQGSPAVTASVAGRLAGAPPEIGIAITAGSTDAGPITPIPILSTELGDV